MGDSKPDGCGNKSPRSGPCDRCYSYSDTLSPITTVVNGIERKEWVCPTCEPEAREDEKPARCELRSDGGQPRNSKPQCVDCGAEIADGVDREYWCECGRQFDKEIAAAWHEDQTGHRTHRMEVA